MEEALKKNIVLTRDKAKEMFLIVLYSQNSYMPSLKKMFAEELFPTIYKILAFLKETDHSFLACLMQQIESRIILDFICKRIWLEGKHKVPVITIHDSVATIEEHEVFIEKIMLEELTRLVGIKPSLSIEKWSKTALQ